MQLINVFAIAIGNVAVGALSEALTRHGAERAAVDRAARDRRAAIASLPFFLLAARRVRAGECAGGFAPA